MSIDGIKSIDFLVTAEGEGVINHNGAFTAYSPAAGEKVSNHLFPKLRGVDPFQKVRSEHDGQERTMSVRLDDPAFSKATLLVSAACIRSGLFRDVSHGLQEVTTDNAAAVLAGLHGLVRGYLITRGGRNLARKSPLYVTDFDCVEPGLVFSQGSNAHTRGTEREDTSLYSYYATAKNLTYTGRASLSVEDLRFIPLEDSLGRSCYDFTTSIAEGERIAAAITQHLRHLAPEGATPTARFVKKAVRQGSIEPVGDAGVLLDDAAVEIIAHEVRGLFETLAIRQGKGHLCVNNVVVDYNDTTRLFRGEQHPDAVVDSPTGRSFAAYYVEDAEISDEDYEADQKRRTDERKTRASRKDTTGRSSEKATKKRATKPPPSAS